MITPEYLRRITERMQRIAQDMEDEMLVTVVIALLSEEDPFEELASIAENFDDYGNSEIERIFSDVVDKITDMAKEVAENAPSNAPDESKPEEIKPSATGEAKPSAERAPTGAPKPTGEPSKQPTRKPPETISPNSKNPTDVPVDNGLTPSKVNQTVNKMKETWYNLTHTQAYAANETYVGATDKAYLKVITEDVPLSKALQEGVDELAEQGLTVVVNQRAEHTDVAMSRNLRTAVAQMAGEASLQQAKANGYNLVLVSAHLGARPTHEVWQGKIFSLNGATDKYGDFKTETGYGQVDGLCGINCRHTFAPWREGMGNPFADVDPEESRKRYELEQKQRAMERRIRTLKRKVKALQAEVDQTGEPKQKLKEAKAELRDARREYKEFCAENDLRELTERLRIDD